MGRLQSLQLFAEVARRESFAAAARELGVTPSTVAKAVSRLEKALHLRLFHRTTRRVKLTSDGERLFARSQRVIDELEFLEAEALGITDRPTGVLRLDLPIVFGRQIVVPLLAKMALKHPDLQLDVRLSDAFVDLVEEGVDLAVRIGSMSDSGLVARRIAQQQWILCAAPSYLAIHGHPADLRALVSHRAIVFRMPTTGRDQTWHFSAEGEAHTVRPPSHVRFTDGETMARAVELGMGIAQLPNYMVDQSIAEGRLVELLAGYRPDSTPIHAVMPANRLVPGRVRTLLDALYQLDAEPLRQASAPV